MLIVPTPLVIEPGIARTTGANPANMRLFAAQPRPQDVAFDGSPCRTVVAVEDAPAGASEVWHCILLDCRPIQSG